MTKPVSIPHPGLRARDVRQRRGMTLDEVAEIAELSKGYLSRFERGEKTFSVAALIRLGVALQVSVGTLLGEDIDNDEIHLVRAAETPRLARKSRVAAARRAPSARLYSRVPRSSAWPSIVIE